MRVWPLGQEDPLEEGMATHSSIFAWRIPWTEEPGGPQYIGSQRVGHDRRLSAPAYMLQGKKQGQFSQSDIVASVRKEGVWLIRYLFSPSKLELGCLPDYSDTLISCCAACSYLSEFCSRLAIPWRQESYTLSSIRCLVLNIVQHRFEQ